MDAFVEALERAFDRDPALAALAVEERRALLPCFVEQRFAEGDVVVREGDGDRAMYVLVSGKASVSRGGVEVLVLDRPSHFGELALVAERPRAASVVALTPLCVARLGHEEFASLERDRPALAARFVRALLSSVGDRLVEMTESVGLLLRERSLPRRATVTVRAQGERVTTRNGTPVGALLPHAVDGATVVAALIDRKPVSLTTPVTSACTVEPLTTAHWEGKRIFRQSLTLLLLEAAHQVDPSLDVRAEHSAGFALRLSVFPEVEDRAELALRVQEVMNRLVEEDRLLREEWWTVDEARAHFEETGWTGAAARLATWRDLAVPLATYGEVYSLHMGPLIGRTSILAGYGLAPDEVGLLMLYGPEAATRPRTGSGAVPSVLPPRASKRPSSLPPPPGVPREVAREARIASRQLTTMTEPQERWLAGMGIESVGDFNQACISGSVSSIIRVSEGFHEKRIADIAHTIAEQHDQVRVVCIAGPSSTGKTTFIKRLSVQLQVLGIRPVGVSLDDYYVDRVDTPKDEKGEYDFEAFEALDAELLQDQLGALLGGRVVSLARYDFSTGLSHPQGGPDIALATRDVLLLEGIHGLNPRLLTALPSESVLRVFVCPLAQLPIDRATRVHGSDVRLLRRIVRDRHSRGHDAAATIGRWPSVRQGERTHIFPFQQLADAIFDTSLLYEPSVLKVYAERYLFEVPQDHPSYTTAYRLLGLLDGFVPIYPDHVPPTSILREFIGGSGFEY